MLLYHIHPSGSLTLGQLSAAGNLTTVLGQDLNANYPLQASTNTTNGVSSHSNYVTLHFPINSLPSPLCSVQGLPRVSCPSFYRALAGLNKVEAVHAL